MAMTYDQARGLIAERFPGAQVLDPPAGAAAAHGATPPAPAVTPAATPALAVTVPAEHWVAFATFAKETLGCRFFSFSSAVDWKDDGLEVIARVDNVDDNVFVLMKTRLGPGMSVCPSLTSVYRGANWMERECYDMFGIRFDGHPDLRRILLSDDWQGHPLLKSYAVDTPYPPYR